MLRSSNWEQFKQDEREKGQKRFLDIFFIKRPFKKKFIL